MDEDYPSAADGVLYFTLLLKEGATLPSFINVVDPQGTLADVIMVHTDQGRRHCYRCGHTGHQARFCRAAHRHPGAPASLWSTLVLPLPAAESPAPAPAAPAVSAPPASPAPATTGTLSPAPAPAVSVSRPEPKSPAASPKREKPAVLATPFLPPASASSPPAPAATPAADPLDPGEGQVLTPAHEKEEGSTGSPERSRSPLRPEKLKKLPKKRPK